MKKALITILMIGCCVPVYAKPPINGVSAVEGSVGRVQQNAMKRMVMVCG